MSILSTLWGGLKLFRPIVKVHIVTAGITFQADGDLMKQVSRGLQLVKTDQKESRVTILFCPINSRVGADVEAAISMVSGDKKVILVLMHHTRDENYSTAGTKWSETYPNVILDVHVLYHESVPGLLTCSQNRNAVNHLDCKLRDFSENTRCSKIWKVCCRIISPCTLVLTLVSLSAILWLFPPGWGVTASKLTQKIA